MAFCGVNSLFKSTDFILTAKEFPPTDGESGNETLIWQDSNGPLSVSRVDNGSGNFYRLRHGDEISVDVLIDQTLAIGARCDVPATTVDHFLADQVFPRLVSQTGEFVLHSSAVSNGDHAIVFLGPSGWGKSTLAANFMFADWTLISDDAVIISDGSHGAVVRAVYRSLRLYPDSIDAVVTANLSSRSVADYTTKRRLDLPFSSQSDALPCAISAIFVLSEPNTDGPISIHRRSIADACMSLVEHSFALDPTDARRAAFRLAAASRMARDIPTFTLSFPHDYSQLPNVRAAISGQVAAVLATHD